jgi:hypothetical protein
MLQLDNILSISPRKCIKHQIIICCVCAVVCHAHCDDNRHPGNDDNKVDEKYNDLSCECESNYHSEFNELAFSFPLEQYKQDYNIDIWPIQILNILFSTKSNFQKMSMFLQQSLSYKNILNGGYENITTVHKLGNLLELFSNTFNRKFKTYYYHEEMSKMFDFDELFNFIKKIKITNGINAIIEFRLFSILLFMHLKKDFNTLKTLTTNDFYCNNVLERLKLKCVRKSGTIFFKNIQDKYKLNGNSPIKNFILESLCNLIMQGMAYISVEKNQIEFLLGLKLMSFMLKMMVFDRKDIILLIDSLYDFHSNFYKYIMSEKNNIYSLIDIFNTLVEICFIISVYYNDLVIEEYLDNKEFDKINKFIHVNSEHGIKLLTIL